MSEPVEQRIAAAIAEAVKDVAEQRDSIARASRQVEDSLRTQLAAAQAAMKQIRELTTLRRIHQIIDANLKGSTAALDAAIAQAIATEKAKYESFVPIDDQINIAIKPLVDAAEALLNADPHDRWKEWSTLQTAITQVK